jgi:DHA2 family multidrug resistance protein
MRPVMGVFAVLSAPIVGQMAEKYDPRKIIFAGIMGLAGLAAWRTSFNSDVTFWQAAMPTLLTGPFMVMFFIPTIGLAMASVDPGEEANAAGVSNFMRTVAGAFATSLVQTGWENEATRRKAPSPGPCRKVRPRLIAWLTPGKASKAPSLPWINWFRGKA